MMKETSSLMTTDYLFKVENLENYFLIQYKRYLLNASLDFVVKFALIQSCTPLCSLL